MRSVRVKPHRRKKKDGGKSVVRVHVRKSRTNRKRGDYQKGRLTGAAARNVLLKPAADAARKMGTTVGPADESGVL